MHNKIGQLKVRTSVANQRTIETNYFFYSYNKGSAAFKFRLKNQKNEALDLTNVTVKLLFTGVQDGEERKFTYYKVVGQTYEEWGASKDSVVSRPFTEVEPPKGPDVMIAGFDWETNQWIWVRGVPYDLYVRSNQIAANTMKEVTKLRSLVERIQDVVFPKEEITITEGEMPNVSN